MEDKIKTSLPKNPFNNIAISMSGGGYRATTFHLGVLTYLSTIKFKDISLLERIRIISTVSGGTFTGVKYSTTMSIEQTYKDLYKFMTETDLIEDCLNVITNNKFEEKANKSLINAVSLVYFEKFENNKFSILFENKDFHIKEIIFNATEFSYALPFRFQKTESADNSFAYIGNRNVNIDIDSLKEIRLSDVTAASSCFPLGFEPINFPEDFIYKDSVKLKSLKHSKGKDNWGDLCEFPIGLMDGGIVDNQGVDSVIWAEERMSKYPENLQYLISKDKKAVDLLIISDVSSPFMEGLKKTESKKIKYFGNLNFNSLKVLSIIALLLSILSFIFIPSVSNKLCITSLSAAGTIFLILFFIMFFVSGGFVSIAKKVGVNKEFLNKLKQLNKINFNIYRDLIMNRLNSAKTMVSDVFMKQLRRFSYDKVYNDDNWKVRVVSNTIYELTESEVKLRNNDKNKKILNEKILNPSTILQHVAEKAFSMGTTLWFTPEQLTNNNDLKHNMPDIIIACGQFTICFNLIEYIEKILWNSEYPDNFKNNEEIINLHQQLLSDWNKFNENPFWMVDETNKKYCI